MGLLSPTFSTRGRQVFTAGQVAKICRVAPRTVAKWYDSGRIKGYRIPGSQDRRIPREELISFLRRNGMPLGDLEDSNQIQVLAVACENHHLDQLRPLIQGTTLREAVDGFAAGIECVNCFPDVVVIDLQIGRGEAIAIAKRIKDLASGERQPLLICLVSEDETDRQSLQKAGFEAIYQKPLDPQLIARRIKNECDE